ncbi:Elf1-domain-containing protein [Acaromyces ingoldii]|uniref:Transcription elongation factor 1 homolog n=1 Tax=Acaromyces ingoldii TaxID=215250 RepID=A0A316YQC6_9BASI|nr:Elf1-domain-containing protein [Acaromyces ingoldii]PWN91226.1 Elf1-domain-containing protein [Acaromyces ingoldii]
MGKRKKSTRNVGGSKKREPLDTVFKCLFCKHEKAVTCKISDGNATLICKICGQSFSCRTNALTAPIDVYSEWIDATEEVNAGA